jgi:hypothetical protein
MEMVRLFGALNHDPLAAMIAAFHEIRLVDRSYCPTVDEMAMLVRKGVALPLDPAVPHDIFHLCNVEDPSAYARGLNLMIDNHRFLRDSIYCEWAYIVNLDAEVLEVHVGWNTDPRAPGRYAHLQREHTTSEIARERVTEYFGVRHLASFPLREIWDGVSAAEFSQRVRRMHRT